MHLILWWGTHLVSVKTYLRPRRTPATTSHSGIIIQYFEDEKTIATDNLNFQWEKHLWMPPHVLQLYQTRQGHEVGTWSLRDALNLSKHNDKLTNTQCLLIQIDIYTHPPHMAADYYIVHMYPQITNSHSCHETENFPLNCAQTANKHGP